MPCFFMADPLQTNAEKAESDEGGGAGFTDPLGNYFVKSLRLKLFLGFLLSF